MRVTISTAHRFDATAVEGELTTEKAAAFQHPAICALRAAFGWNEGRFDEAAFTAFLLEEAARIPAGSPWAAYRRVSRSGSRFLTDRRTRAAVYTAVVTSRALGRL